MFLKFPIRFALALFLAVPVAPAVAHELWIEPEQYQVEKGNPIQAQFMNGQEFKGITLSYFERGATRFDVMVNGDIAKVEARSGDLPAFKASAPNKDGLMVVVYETTPSNLTYKEWPKFLKFVAHKDFATAEADHISAGWPKENFRESYTRHAKALIGVGTGEGADTAMGLQTEFIALTNPYSEDFGGQMDVLLNYKDAPRPDAQVEVFDRAPDETVTITLHRTDENGVASIPVIAGHTYLFDAVILRPSPEAMKTDKSPLWETLWAALTFQVPN